MRRHRKLRSAGAIALIAISAPATHAFASPEAVSTIQKAAKICEKATQGGRMIIPAEAEIYVAAPVGPAMKPLSALPDLLKRYGATSWPGAPTMYLRFAGNDGDAWSAIRGELFTCDVVATGFHGSVKNQEVLDQLTSEGWATVVSRAASQPGALSQFVMVKMQPNSTSPNYGIKAHIKSVGFSEATADGIQMEIGFVAGEVQIRGQQNRSKSNAQPLM